MTALVIIPTYNERQNLELLAPAILTLHPTIHLLVVDDASPDGTGDLAQQLGDADERIHLIRRSGKLGLGTAYITGFHFALEREFEAVVQMDADFSHRPADLSCLLEHLDAADVVIGSRNIPGGQVEAWSLLRRAVSRGGSMYARFMLKLPIADCTSGFKCFRRTVLESIDLASVRSNGYAFQVEMNYLCHRAGFSIREVPIIFPNREVGQSKMTIRIALEAAALGWRLRRLGSQRLPASATLDRVSRGVRETPSRNTPRWTSVPDIDGLSSAEHVD
jgi:dolichol-phosphate mannosyltransferase